MALVFRGRTRCWICGGVLQAEDSIVMFPPFVGNRNDPMYPFSDSALHEGCFDAHPLAADVRNRVDQATPASARTCHLCRRDLTDLDDWFGLPAFGSVTDRLLQRVSAAQFHLSCLRAWPERTELGRRLRETYVQENWDWPGLLREIDSVLLSSSE